MRLIISRSIRIFFVLSFICLNSGCNQSDSKTSEILSIPLELTIERFDEKFHLSQASDIPQLKKEYPFLFPEKFDDSVWVKRQKDTLQILLQDAVIKVFDNIKPLEKKVSNLFKHIKHYFPSTKIPQVITLTNNVDYQIKTVYSDSLLLISLDTFLGSDNILYEGIPNYIRKELDQKYIPSQIVEKFSAYVIPPLDNRTFLAHMLYEGKKLFLQDLLLPQDEDNIKIAYSKNELDWVIKNEVYHSIDLIILIFHDFDTASFGKSSKPSSMQPPPRARQYIGSVKIMKN